MNRPFEAYDQLSAFKLYSLVAISKKINSLMEIDQLLEMIMESVKTLLGCEGSSLMFVDEERKVLTFRVVTGEKIGELKEIEVPLGQGIAGAVALSGEPIVVNDAQNDPRLYRAADERTSMTTRNIVCVPMATSGRIIGVLEAINCTDRAEFSDDDLLLLMAFAEQAAISITNRKLYDRVKARVEELTALHEISQLALVHGNQPSLFEHCVKITARVIGCEKCSILLYDKERDALTVKAAIGIEPAVRDKISVPLDGEIAAQVFKNARFIFSENVDTDPRFGRNKRFRYSSGSFVSVPMQTKEKAIGVLNASDKHTRRPFNIFDVQLLQTIANQISEVYENLRLYDEERTKLKMEKELEVTRRLQEAIFPKRFPELPGVLPFAINLSAEEVGGDFYDFFWGADRPGQFSALIADVSGKSLPAALFMAIARSTIRAQALADMERAPSKILDVSNRFLLEDSESAMFVTAFLFACDTATRTITYSNGGHNDPLLVRSKDGAIERLHTRGKPLGVLASESYEDKTVTYAPGDYLVLYTDGVIEANNEAQEEFGLDALERVVAEGRTLSPSALAQRITDAVTEHAGSAPQFDDITLFLFKFS